MVNSNTTKNRGSFKHVYYHKPSLEALLQLPATNEIKEAIKKRLTNFSVYLGSTGILGWTYRRDITLDNYHLYDEKEIVKALNEERAFLQICKPLLSKHARYLNLVSFHAGIRRIEEVLALVAVKNMKQDGRAGLNSKMKSDDVSWVEILTGAASVIGAVGGIISLFVRKEMPTKK